MGESHRRAPTGFSGSHGGSLREAVVERAWVGDGSAGLGFLTLGLAHGTWKLPKTHVPER